MKKYDAAMYIVKAMRALYGVDYSAVTSNDNSPHVAIGSARAYLRFALSEITEVSLNEIELKFNFENRTDNSNKGK